MNLFDTSFIVAFVNERDALHGAALSTAFPEGCVNELVLAESANVISRASKNFRASAAVIRDVYDRTPLEFLAPDDVRDAMSLFERHSQKLSFNDCALLAQARRLGAGIITFDEDLKRAAKNAR